MFFTMDSYLWIDRTDYTLTVLGNSLLWGEYNYVNRKTKDLTKYNIATMLNCQYDELLATHQHSAHDRRLRYNKYNILHF